MRYRATASDTRNLRRGECQVLKEMTRVKNRFEIFMEGLRKERKVKGQ